MPADPDRKPDRKPDKPSPRRSRLFRNRYVDFRPSEPADLRYAGAAWKMGLRDLGGFEAPEDVAPNVFLAGLQEYLTAFYQHHYTLMAETRMGRRPVGIACLYQPDPRKAVLISAEMIWFPWASRRNKLETLVHFLNRMREHWTVLEFCRRQDQAFFDHICRYGVMRRIGTMACLYGDDTSPAYQTRKPMMMRG